jgi:carboxymethylenebutenolidase
MIVIDTESVDLPTSTGPMRTHIVRPAAPGRYPGILLFSEIFQVTAPIHRTAVQLAGHGYVVAVPEVYHEYEPSSNTIRKAQTAATSSRPPSPSPPMMTMPAPCWLISPNAPTALAVSASWASAWEATSPSAPP